MWKSSGRAVQSRPNCSFEVKIKTPKCISAMWNHFTTHNGYYGLSQGFTNPRWWVARMSKSSTVAPNICRSSVRNLLHVTPVTPRILRWVINFLKICMHLACLLLDFYNAQLQFTLSVSRIHTSITPSIKCPPKFESRINFLSQWAVAM